MFLENDICSGGVIDVNFKMSNTSVNEEPLMAKKNEFASRIWQHKRVCEVAVCMGFPVPVHIH